ncbi:MAG: YitT family protein [Candidatus Phytoplasma pyri]|uniref:YitT family protein n=1 Tax=Candidatus Phytoplasma pyri TaxID=47566 RepID=UPI0039836A41
MVCCFLFGYFSICFFGTQYKCVIYTSGIYGVSDAISRLLIKIEILKKEYKDYFASFLYIMVNLLLFLFIALPKLDKNFNINAIFSIVFISLFVSFFSFNILENTKNEGFFAKSKNFFGIFDTESTELNKNILRAILSGILISICLIIPIKIGSSTGGIDIIAKYLFIYKNKDISLVIIIFNYSISFFFVLINFFSNPEEGFNINSILLSNLKMISFSITTYFLNPSNKKKYKK